MSPWVVTALSIIALLVVVGVLLPFWRKIDGQMYYHTDVEEDFNKAQWFGQLSDLEYDYHMNKITKEDYQKLKDELTRKAANVINDPMFDQNQLEQKVDEEIRHYLSTVTPLRKETSE
jgi:cytochrome c-type biogenesis protein CcmI